MWAEGTSRRALSAFQFCALAFLPSPLRLSHAAALSWLSARTFPGAWLSPPAIPTCRLLRRLRRPTLKAPAALLPGAPPPRGSEEEASAVARRPPLISTRGAPAAPMAALFGRLTSPCLPSLLSRAALLSLFAARDSQLQQQQPQGRGSVGL